MASDLLQEGSAKVGSKHSNYGSIEANSKSLPPVKQPAKKKTQLCDYLIDPHHWPYCCIMLLLQCYILFAAFYCAESPGGLESTIIQVMEVDTTQYGLLISVYAWPNTVLCLIGGVLVDRVLGRRVSYILVIAITGIGQFIWALGAFLNHFWLMLVGRFLIGVGTEMTDVVSTGFAAKWTNVTFLLSMLYTAARLGASSALALPQFVYESLKFIKNPLYQLGMTLLLGVGFAIVSIVIGIIVIILDKREERILQKKQTNVLSKIRCSDLKAFSRPYWVSTGMISIYVPILLVYTGIGQVFLMRKFGMSTVAAGTANSFVFCSAILIAPLMGFLINIMGHHASWSLLGAAMATSTHVLLLMSNGSQSFVPYLAGGLYSVSYAITIPSLYSIPGLVVSPNQTSTAYGIVHCCYNIVVSILSVASGVLIDYAGYFVLELTFSLLHYIMVTMSLILVVIYKTPKVKKGQTYRQEHEETDPLKGSIVT